MTTYADEIKEERKERQEAQAALCALAIDGWQIVDQTDKEGYTNWVTLKKGDEQLFITANAYGNRGKFRVSGHYPNDANGQESVGYTNKRAEPINIGMTKTPKRVWQDIERRFMPEYRQVLAKANKLVAASLDCKKVRDASADKVMRAMDEDRRHNSDPLQPKFWSYDYDIDAGVNYTGERVELKMGSLSPDEAVKVINMVKGFGSKRERA